MRSIYLAVFFFALLLGLPGALLAEESKPITIPFAPKTEQDAKYNLQITQKVFPSEEASKGKKEGDNEPLTDKLEISYKIKYRPPQETGAPLFATLVFLTLTEKISTVSQGQKVVETLSATPEGYQIKINDVRRPPVRSANPFSFLGKAFTLYFNADGSVKEIKSELSKTEKTAAPKQVHNFDLSALARLYLPPLPPKPVKVKDTWTKEVELPVADGGGAKMKATLTYTYEGTEEFQGLHCAKISFKGSFTREKATVENERVREEVSLQKEIKDGSFLIDFGTGEVQRLELSMSGKTRLERDKKEILLDLHLLLEKQKE
jgi:hypothetical protein